MDWFDKALWCTALILLGVAIIFLIYGGLTGVFDEKKMGEKAPSFGEKSSSHVSNACLDSQASLADLSSVKTEVTAEEKEALQGENKNLWSNDQHSGAENTYNNDSPHLPKDGSLR